jgi:hypothetical protein
MSTGRYRYPQNMDWVSGSPGDAAAEAAQRFLEQRMAAHVFRYGGGGYFSRRF